MGAREGTYPTLIPAFSYDLSGISVCATKCYPPKEARMRMLPNVLIILATLGLLVGLIIRLVKGGFLGDPVFFWRGAMALLAIAIALLLIQIRNK